MLFHYALVDDLITKEEFEHRVDRKIEECGDLVDEPTAAMLVVGELGRQHVKIQGLSGKSSLFSFFGKVLDKTEPREFNRPDGEKGWVATLLVGDETGTTRVVLWDEKAGAALDLEAGEVLEIIGRHPGKSTKEIYALALRKASCDIACAIPAPGTDAAALSAGPVALDAVLLGTGEIRTFRRRDGTTGEMVEAVIGDTQGTARLVAWVPILLTAVPPGSVVHITGAKPDHRSGGRAYSLDEKSTVTVIDREITPPFSPVVSVSDEGTYSVQGTVRDVREPRSFIARDGSSSWVRNITLSDGTGAIRVVLWGEKALVPVAPGDRVEVYHATAKPGRSGGIELGVGRGSVFRVPVAESRPIDFTGTIIAGQGCLFIDNGKERYIIDGEFPHGAEMRVTGTAAGDRITPRGAVPAGHSYDEVIAHLERLRKGSGG
ncbi:MAG TPA: nucleic acid-binding protein [Methanoregula sp.]|nr:nucleic acid-binding protein [Methanoregula sp.]